MWKNTRQWRDVVSEMPGFARFTSVDVDNLSFIRLPHLACAHIAASQSLHDTYYFCSWDEKDTLFLGVLLPRERLWPDAPILNVTGRVLQALEQEAPLILQYRFWRLSLKIPIFALFNDNALKSIAAWYRGLGVERASSFQNVSTHVEWFDRRYVLIQRTLTRKNSLFSKGAPVEEVMAQAHTELMRLHDVAHHALQTPLRIPSNLGDAIEWLDQRFLQARNHPSAPELRDVYQHHGATLLEGWWMETRPTQLVLRGDGQLDTGEQYHSAIKHAAIRALSRPEWAKLRRQLMAQHLAIKNTYASSGQNNSRDRQPLDPMLAWQALLFAHKFRPQGETEGWFKPTTFGEDILGSTFKDIDRHLRPIYFAYALEDCLMQEGVDEMLLPTQEGGLTIKNWMVHGEDGKLRLRLDDPRFMNAFITLWQRHPWTPQDIPQWAYPIFEARFIAGDLRVADVLVYHPEHVRILREVCSVHTQRIRWMISWLGHHAYVVDASLMPALFELSPEMIASLDALELSALYEHLERADSALRKEHLDKTKLIVKLAIEKLGAESFDLLDGILKDTLDADLMAFVTQHIDALPRLSAKRRALKREQREALQGIDLASFQGQISLHHSDGSLRGALSQDYTDQAGN